MVKILKLALVNILNFKFSQDANVWLGFSSECLVEILKMKFDQDLCLKLWYELNPRVRCAFGNVYYNHLLGLPKRLQSWKRLLIDYMFLFFCLNITSTKLTTISQMRIEVSVGRKRKPFFVFVLRKGFFLYVGKDENENGRETLHFLHCWILINCLVFNMLLSNLSFYMSIPCVKCRRWYWLTRGSSRAPLSALASV